MNFFSLGCLVFLSATASPTAPATNPPPVAPAPAATKPDPFADPLIKQVQARHEKAVNGDTKETKALAADLEKWTAAQPNNALLEAYLGSTYTLCSRDAWPGPSKLTYLKNGGHLLNAAVVAAPDNPAVRFVRAIDFFELPAIFGKRQVARDDFEYLVRQIEGAEPCPYSLDVPTRQAIYYYAGLSYRQLSQAPEAETVWKRGWALDPASPLGVKIKAALGQMK